MPVPLVRPQADLPTLQGDPCNTVQPLGATPLSDLTPASHAFISKYPNPYLDACLAAAAWFQVKCDYHAELHSRLMS